VLANSPDAARCGDHGGQPRATGSTATTANPHRKRLKKGVTIRLDGDAVGHFKAVAAQTGVPYRTLISLYLAGCAATERKKASTWV
jgi:hypothetical protein